jgi:hypothetical protein
VEKLHVQVNRRAQIENDRLGELYGVSRRNKSADCELADNALMRQVLDLAADKLRGSHVFVARFGDGSEVFFTGGVLPPFVSVEAVLRSAGW